MTKPSAQIEIKITNRANLQTKTPKTISKGAVSSGFFGFWVLDVARTTVRLTVKYVSVCVCLRPTKPASHRWGTVTYSTPEKGMSSMWPETRPDQARPDKGIHRHRHRHRRRSMCVRSHVFFHFVSFFFCFFSSLSLYVSVCRAPRPPVTWRFYFRSICGHKYSVKCHLVVACVVEFEMK